MVTHLILNCNCAFPAPPESFRRPDETYVPPRRFAMTKVPEAATAKPLRIATRGSQLALAQTQAIIGMFTARHPGLRCEIVEITTHGDRFQDVPITQMGDQVERGIFNTALEEAVLEGLADLATCSFKDVESQLPAG